MNRKRRLVTGFFVLLTISTVSFLAAFVFFCKKNHQKVGFKPCYKIRNREIQAESADDGYKIQNSDHYQFVDFAELNFFENKKLIQFMSNYERSNGIIDEYGHLYVNLNSATARIRNEFISQLYNPNEAPIDPYDHLSQNLNFNTQLNSENGVYHRQISGPISEPNDDPEILHHSQYSQNQNYINQNGFNKSNVELFPIAAFRFKKKYIKNSNCQHDMSIQSDRVMKTFSNSFPLDNLEARDKIQKGRINIVESESTNNRPSLPRSNILADFNQKSTQTTDHNALVCTETVSRHQGTSEFFLMVFFFIISTISLPCIIIRNIIRLILFNDSLELRQNFLGTTFNDNRTIFNKLSELLCAGLGFLERIVVDQFFKKSEVTEETSVYVQITCLSMLCLLFLNFEKIISPFKDIYNFSSVQTGAKKREYRVLVISIVKILLNGAAFLFLIWYSFFLGVLVFLVVNFLAFDLIPFFLRHYTVMDWLQKIRKRIRTYFIPIKRRPFGNPDDYITV